MNVFPSLKQRWITLARGEEGLAYIEMAFSIGILIILFFGAVEVTRYILIIQKLEKTTTTVTDVVAQTDPISNPLGPAGMAQLLNAAQNMMNPYGFGTNGIVFVTDVVTDAAGSATIKWRSCGGGSLAQASQIGSAPGGAATLPAGFAMAANQEVVIGEAFYNFTPITALSVLGPTLIYRTAVYMPRLSSINGAYTCP